MKTERLQYFEDNCLLGKLTVCSAIYIKNGNINCNIDKSTLLLDIAVCNTRHKVDHLWVKDTKKVKATEIWKSKQHKMVYFIAKFIKVTKPYKLFEDKEDLSLKIIKIIK